MTQNKQYKHNCDVDRKATGTNLMTLKWKSNPLTKTLNAV